MTKDGHPPSPAAAPSSRRGRSPAAEIPPGRLWAYRLFAGLVVPVVMLALLEGALRLGGLGHRTGFTRACDVNGVASRCDNASFTWQFFPPQIARAPIPFAFPVDKPENTFRIFVVGGSAAQGDPEPSFGFARILEVLLRDRHPALRFEIINAGVTAINSHVVLPITRDLVRYDPDLLLIYLGNNEVVGPFGAGTVFSPLSRSRTMIRAGLWLRGTRIGQLLGRALDAGGGPADRDAWGGMEMFLEQRVRMDDPRMEAVYGHFRDNLRDILRAARGSGALVVISTVGTNLRDCAPFASLHRADLGVDERAEWEAAYEAIETSPGASEAYDVAERIDPTYADLQYRLARREEERGDPASARDHYVRARDRDALRFRADTRINEIIRSAAESARDGVVLVDGAAALAARSPGGAPGAALFDDHVHPTFTGNYVLARALLDAVESLLPGPPAGGPPLDAEASAARLAYTGFDRRRVLEGTLGRAARPPFTNQSNHREQLARLQEEVAALARFTTSEGMAEADRAYREAIGRSPQDPWLRYNHGVLLETMGAHEEAAAAFQATLTHLPQLIPAREGLSSALAAGGAFEEALAVCVELNEDEPGFLPPYYTRAYALARLGRYDDSLDVYRRLLELDPGEAPQIWAEIAKLLDAAGRAEEARDARRRAAGGVGG